MSEPYLVQPNFNHAPMDEDKKTFCRVGKHHDEIGDFTEVENYINLMVAPSGSYILRPFDGMWTLKVEGVDIFEKYRDISSRVKGTDYVTGLENYFSSNTTSILLLNDLDIHPEDTKKEYARRSGTIFNAENEMMTFDVFLEKRKGLYVVTNNNIYILDDNSDDLLNGLLNEIKDKHDKDVKALQDKDAEQDKKHDNDVKVLQDKDKEHDNSITNLLNKINVIMQYYNQKEDNTLIPKFDTFELTYNKNYVSEVNPWVRVDTLNGMVHVNIRMKLKAVLSANDSIKIAELPADFMPALSSAMTWIVRDEVVTDVHPEGQPSGKPTNIDGVAVCSYTDMANTMPYIRVLPFADVPIDHYIYVGCSYFLPEEKIGKQNLSKALVVHDEFVKEGSL